MTTIRIYSFREVEARKHNQQVIDELEERLALTGDPVHVRAGDFKPLPIASEGFSDAWGDAL